MATEGASSPELPLSDGEGPLPADGEEPTTLEKRTLCRVGENLPKAAYIVAVVELCERFTYYGAQGLFQNYVSKPFGLDLGRKTATALTIFFTFFAYLTPILGAVLADQYFGRYRTILGFAAVYLLGLLILWTTALPSFLEHGAGLGGFIAAIITIGLGTGGIKANRVIIDPAITYHRIYLVYYGCIELGSLSIIGTPFMEKKYGFWSPFLLTFCMFIVAVTLLVLGRQHYTIRQPQGSIIQTAFKAVFLMILGRSLDAPKPSVRAANGKTSSVPWDDHFIEELKRTLNACKVFAFYPIIWVRFAQMSSNLVSQAGEMEGHGLPNDFMQSLERIHLIYSAGPCFTKPLGCKAAKIPGSQLLRANHVHMAVQTPLYVFFGFASIFLNVASPEYAYTNTSCWERCPSLKSFIQSLYLLTVAFGAALAEALVSVSDNPDILWMYVGVAGAVAVIGTTMYLYLGHLDTEEDKWNALDKREAVILSGERK
ncbi:hypothetical protein BCR34DRAFT_625130 [Clohesyomyces aquaticus]|uniref:POT family-domain-containing protein n=1 Tax=Clohesyomyces aquaticus TaxID=1231657 RepID=A0A1Y1ZLP9_9PLEO|nr:hypothetical protein BCR34DRAFT_625130 [Clohesyomyces aquaticus]